jgi:O-antigen/teichoic acid export membrane protein/capsular polysaccharide biosynthesis protein
LTRSDFDRGGEVDCSSDSKVDELRIKGAIQSRVDGFRTALRLLLEALGPTRRRHLLGAMCAAVALAVGGLAGVSWSMAGPKVYTATGTAFVKFNFPPSELDPFSAREFVSERIDSYAQLATAANVLVAVQVDIPGYTVEELQRKIQVSSPPGTVLLQSTATDPNPRTAARLADSVLAQLGVIVAGAEGDGSVSGGSPTSPILIQQVQSAILPVTPTTAIDKTKFAAGAGAGALLGGVLWLLIWRRRSKGGGGGDRGEVVPDSDHESDGRHHALDESASLTSEDTVEVERADKSNLGSIGRILFAAGGARMLVLPITGLCSLVIARLVTKAVGIDEFGVVMLVATLCQLLMFADLGTGAAVASSRAQLDQSKNADTFRGTVLTAVRTTLFSSVLIGFGAALLGVVGAWPYLLGIQQSNLASSLNISAVLALSVFAVALPFSVGEAILRGSGRLHEAVLLQGIAPPAALLLTIVFRQIGVPALAYALVLPIGALIAAICCATRAWTVDQAAVRGLLGKLLRPRRFRGAPIAATAVPMFIVMIGLPIALNSDRVVIAHRLDAANLSNYSYASQLYLPLWSIASTAAVALWPRFARQQSDRAEVRRGWLAGVAMLTGLGLVMAVCFLLFSKFLIGWMSASQAAPPRSLLIAFSVLLFVQAAHVGTGIFLIAPEMLRFQAVCVVALVLTNLPLSWILAPRLGVAGPVYASAITVFVCQLVPGVLRALRASRPLRIPQPQGKAPAYV